MTRIALGIKNGGLIFNLKSLKELEVYLSCLFK